VHADQVLARIHPEDRQPVQQAMVDGLRSGYYSAEFRVLGEDGSVRWVMGQARALVHADGETYVVGINLDVTVQKKAEEALRKSEKLAAVGRLASTISHEINNPLEAVTNLLYLIRTMSPDGPVKDYAQVAEEELSRVSHVVTHSLRFHRQSTEAKPERISALLDSAVAVYQGRLKQSATELVCDYRDDAPVICWSAELRQVFANLIGNAFDATRGGGRILLRTRNGRDWKTGSRGVYVTVADSGHGMSQDTQERLFEAFHSTKGINGTGLGLWISKQILDKHGASVRVKSLPGLGTTFHLFFPHQLEALASAQSV
jgi:signal transduction histidine kinase